MRKPIPVIIVIILAVSFTGLTYYGLKHSRGKPAVYEPPKKIILEIPFIDADINFSSGILPDIWKDIDPGYLELMYQITVLPWGKSLVSPVTIKAFHNKKDIFFYMSWHDETEDRILEKNKFSDACAIMFPMKDDVQPYTIMMGFLGHANIWQWKASQDREFWLKEPPKTSAYSDYHYPFEENEIFPVSLDTPKSAVNDLMAIRIATVTPKDTQNIQGRGIWKDNVWQVVFKRSIEPIDPEQDAWFTPLEVSRPEAVAAVSFGQGELLTGFKPGQKRLCAFAVWNGSQGDRGGRKSISDWVELDIK